MKFKIYILYCLFLIGLSGCMSQKELDEALNPMFDLCFASQIYYYNHNNQWPNSIDDLKSFCSENQENCFVLDWNKYGHANLETLPEGSLKIEMYIPDEPNKPLKSKKPNFVMTIPKLTIQKDANDFKIWQKQQ